MIPGSKKLILGTVKFGQDNYGFSSENEHQDASLVFKYAQQNGIEELDTSPRYGDAESLIGHFQETTGRFNVSTKIDLLNPNDPSSESKILKSTLESLKATKSTKFKTVYLHQNEMGIIADKYIRKGMKALLDEGLTETIGTSIYSHEEFSYSLQDELYSVIQTPLNICDSSYVSNLPANHTKKIIARSVFLQGLIPNLSKISRLINGKEMEDYLLELSAILKKHDLTLGQAAIAYINSLPEVSSIIIGTSSEDSLASAISSLQIKLPTEVLSIIRNLAMTPKSWSNPRTWKLK